MKLEATLAAVAVATLLAAAFTPLAAQRGPAWLPAVRYFENPLADPIEPRSGAGLLVTNVLRSRGPERPRFIVPDSARAAREVQGNARIGATLPLLAIARWDDGGVVLAGQAGVDARFRVERPSRDDMAHDWFVAIPIELRRGAWAGRARISHRSAHLGDEFMEQTAARRIEFGGEALDVHAARDFGTTRVYAGGSWIFRSYTKKEPALVVLGRADRFLVQLGSDARRRGGPAGASVLAGVDVQLAERTAWQPQLAGMAGLRWAGPRHAVQLNVRAYDGPSAMGEFFLTPERYVALEFVAEL